MADIQQALATQLANIQGKTGKSLPELQALVVASGLEKHAQIRDMLMRELGLGHGDANTLTHAARNPGDPSRAEAGDDDPGAELERLYAGPKAALRPLHEAVMARLAAFGEFEVAPKKTYLSLRRRKQFAMLGPATNTHMEVGLNLKGVEPGGRLVAVKQPGMCSLKVRLADPGEVDAALLGWLRQAYDQAG